VIFYVRDRSASSIRFVLIATAGKNYTASILVAEIRSCNSLRVQQFRFGPTDALVAHRRTALD